MVKAWKFGWFALHQKIQHRLTVIETYRQDLESKAAGTELSDEENLDLTNMEEEVERLYSYYDDMTDTLGELASELNPRKTGFGLALVYLQVQYIRQILFAAIIVYLDYIPSIQLISFLLINLTITVFSSHY